MVTNIWVQASAPRTIIMQPLHVPASSHPNSGLYLPTRPLRKRVQVKASSTNDSNESTAASKRMSPFSFVLSVPRTMWERTLQPLSDFGFGRRSIWEGGVGLFVVSGVALFALSLAWLRAFHIRSQFKKYQAVFEFTQACGICVGTPVRIRGVTVGNVVKVDSSLKSIDAVVEVCTCSAGFLSINFCLRCF